MSRNSLTRRLNILVAEDDEADFDFLQCMLRKSAAASLFRVSDGEEAISYLEGTGRFSDRAVYPLPDILLLDLNLPKISGHEILEWLQTRPVFRSLRKCVLAGSDLPADRIRAQKGGADDYFVKPLSLGHLAALFGPPIGVEAKP
jgi:CheY-like chemotaxis protein